MVTVLHDYVCKSHVKVGRRRREKHVIRGGKYEVITIQTYNARNYACYSISHTFKSNLGERGEKSVLTLTMIFKYFVKMVLL